MNKKLLISFLAGSFLAAPLALTTHEVNHVIAQEQRFGQQLVALGGSLDAAAQQNTLQLLGASQVPPSNIIYIDGPTINRYLQDGSGPNEIVYSSAYIQGMPEGHGVQVQIVTPQNITLVTPLTYQNAAITAGAKNVNIRIATISPVTGEGALAGVYALLEQSGVAVNPQDVQVAQKEINLVNELEEKAQVSNEVANQALAEIKTEIAKAQQALIDSTGNQEAQLTAEEIAQIVQSVAAKHNITDAAVIEQLKVYATEFAQTEAAKSEDTVSQLDASMRLPWKDTLTNLPGAVAPGEILAGERLDYSNTEVYHPIFQAFADTLYSIVENGQLVDNLYNDTFIYEWVAEEVSPEEKVALNELRTVMYAYAANIDSDIQSGRVQPGYPTLKDEWLRKLQAWEDLNTQDPFQGEIIRRLAISSGRAPQVYDYINAVQEGTVITYENSFVNIDHLSDFTMFNFDVATDRMQELDPVTGVMVDMVGQNIGDKYGVTLVYNYIPHLEIPANYTIPGYIAPTEETTFEETSEEVTETEETSAKETQPLEDSSEESQVSETSLESSEELSQE